VSHKPSKNPNQEAPAQFTSPLTTWPDVVAPAASAEPTKKLSKADAKSGRTVALTPSLCDRICAGIANGLFPEEAAKLAGIHARTFESWLKKGAKGTEPEATLVVAIAQAEATLESELTRAFLAGTDENWQAARDMAARRFPARWSEHAGKAAVFGTEERGPAERIFQINFHLGSEREDVSCAAHHSHGIHCFAANLRSPPDLTELEQQKQKVVDVTAKPPGRNDPDPNLN
jgi:hypothetical protein